MSFALTVKEELCNVANEETLDDFVELEAMLRFGSEVSMSNRGLKLSFSSTSLSILRHFLALLKKFYAVKTQMESRVIKQFEQKTTYTLYLEEDADIICESFNLLTNNKHSKEEILSKENAIKAYLRGAFICKGSVNNPNSGNYHLEIKSTDEEEIVFIQRLMNTFEMNAKICKRRNHLLVYIKDINLICDMLRIMGATNTVYEIESEVIKREVSHSISRNLNCELANETKSFQASKEQMKYIHYLEHNYPLDRLDPKLLLIMKVRKEHLEYSFNELLDVLKDEYGEVMTKSGLNHRFRKLKQIAVEYQKSRGKK